MSSEESSYQSVSEEDSGGSSSETDSSTYDVSNQSASDDDSSSSQDIEMDSYPSTMTVGHLERIRAIYDIPLSVSLRCPGEGEAIHRPPDGEVGFYLKMFDCGVRLPLHHFPQRVLSLAGLAPAQLGPNGWIVVLGFWVLWHLHSSGERLTYKTVYALYRLKNLPKDKFIYYLNFRKHRVVGKPSISRNWKSKWFFVGGDWLAETPKNSRTHRVPKSFRFSARDWKVAPLRDSTKEIINRILSVPIDQREPSILLSDQSLVASGLAQPIVEEMNMTGEAARKYIDDRKRQKCVDDSSRAPKKVTKKQSGILETSVEKRRRESDVGKQSCTTTVPSLGAGPSSHHEIRHLFTNPDSIYYGENDESFENDVGLISSKFHSVLLLDRDCARSKPTQELAELAVEDYLMAGARMNMICVQQGREISRLQEAMKLHEENSSENARLLEIERVENEKMRSAVAEAKRISDQISTRHKKTLLNFSELKAKTEDKEELITMFKAVNQGVDPEVYLFSVGIDAALDEIAERFPDLNLNFVRERFNLPPPSRATRHCDDVGIEILGDSA